MLFKKRNKETYFLFKNEFKLVTTKKTFIKVKR